MRASGALNKDGLGCLMRQRCQTVTQGCRTGRGRRSDMVRQSSPAKGHRTGHYATIAPFGSNGNFCQRASGWQK